MAESFLLKQAQLYFMTNIHVILIKCLFTVWRPSLIICKSICKYFFNIFIIVLNLDYIHLIMLFDFHFRSLLLFQCQLLFNLVLLNKTSRLKNTFLLFILSNRYSFVSLPYPRKIASQALGSTFCLSSLGMCAQQMHPNTFKCPTSGLSFIQDWGVKILDFSPFLIQYPALRMQ